MFDTELNFSRRKSNFKEVLFVSFLIKNHHKNYHQADIVQF